MSPFGPVLLVFCTYNSGHQTNLHLINHKKTYLLGNGGLSLDKSGRMKHVG